MSGQPHPLRLVGDQRKPGAALCPNDVSHACRYATVIPIGFRQETFCVCDDCRATAQLRIDLPYGRL